LIFTVSSLSAVERTPEENILNQYITQIHKSILSFNKVKIKFSATISYKYNGEKEERIGRYGLNLNFFFGKKTKMYLYLLEIKKTHLLNWFLNGSTIKSMFMKIKKKLKLILENLKVFLKNLK